MKKEQIKQILLDAAEGLLVDTEAPHEITTRQIAAKAGTNPAMINYCFASKDELIQKAINRIIQRAAEALPQKSAEPLPPLERLWNMLWELCELVMRFSRFTQLSMPYLLLQGEIETPSYILPLIREYFGETKNETQCRIVAYQLTSFLQLVLYRADSFEKYCGINVMNRDGARGLLEQEFRLLFKEDFAGE